MSDAPAAPSWDRAWAAVQSGDLAGHADDLAASAALADLTAISGAEDSLALLPPLADAVEMAMYWQEPDPVDLALHDDGAREALRPIARVIAESAAARWWPEPAPRGDQRHVEWLDHDGPGALLSGAGEELARWRSAALAEERSAAALPADPAAPYSGHWWSAPAHARLIATSRALPGIGAVGLALVEDPHGWIEARCLPVLPRPGVRVWEISGPGQWADLVARYPLDVTRSRRHDWWRVTGWSGSWLMPDFAAVAADYDAVHLTVLGYLTTAGRALPVDGARTMLAGWDPDTTYWLSDCVEPAGPATWWRRNSDDPARWHQVPAR